MRNVKIKLDEDYRIESDSSCWTLVFDKITGKNEKTGEDKRRYETWYYPSLEIGLKGYRDLKLRAGLDTDKMISLNDVLKRINDLDASIRKVLESCVKEVPFVEPDDKVLDKKIDLNYKRKKRSDDEPSASAKVKA